MKRLIIVCAVLLVSATIHAQSGTDYFVSPFGKDTNPGTKEEPFKTLRRAADVMRKTCGDADEDIHIYMRGGIYPVAEPVVFDTGHSGKKKCRIYIQAYGDEKPVISGGVRITGWEHHKNGIWKAPVNILDFRQLYVNDQRATRSRQPNCGDYYRLKAWDLADKKIIIHGDQISRWNNFQNVEMVLQHSWAESYLRLKSFSLRGTTGGIDAFVTIQDEEREILFPRPYPKKENDQVFHFENAYEFLDEPGEWYLDRFANTLYYKPRAKEDMKYVRVIFPRTETLILIKGTPDRPVRNITFQGITFTHTTWTYPGEHGYLNMQSGQYNINADIINNQYIGRPPAAVTIMNSENICFHRNTFSHLGATGIDLEYGTNSCRVTGNVISEIAGNGISVGKFTRNEETESHVPYNPDDTREICTNDVISNNVIFRTGRDYYGTNAIVAGYPAGLKIEHNVIRDVPYSGIGVGYGWTPAPNAMRDNRIAYNKISGVMNMLADGAGIYTLSLQPGTTIEGNHIYGIRRSEWSDNAPVIGIYLDEASGGTDERPFVLKENLIEASGFRRYNFHATGKVVVDNDYHYLHQEGAREIVDRAGLEPEYRYLETIFEAGDRSPVKTRNIVMTAELRNEDEVIEEYEYLHSAEGVWPEVVHAARYSGIQKIKIYRYGNRLVMIITVPEDLDEDVMNSRYAASSNRITEWDALMKSLLQGPPGAEEGAIWVPMERIHDYENGVVK